ncbi:MAG: aldo/keto reductase [Isosphaeraceae bacterium]
MSPHDPIPPGQPGLTRRVLLQAGTSALTLSAAAAAGTTAPATAPEIDASGAEWRNRQPGMAYRKLGRTNLMVSEVVSGGDPITLKNYKHLSLAIEKGLNYLDMAPAYNGGDTERAYGALLAAHPGLRQKVFLATKISNLKQRREALYRKRFDALPAARQAEIRDHARSLRARSGVDAPGYFLTYFPGQNGSIEGSYLRAAMLAEFGPAIEADASLRAFVRETLEGSLKRVGTDHFDIVMCPHGADAPDDVRSPYLAEVFAELKKEGKLRFMGVTAHNDPGGIVRAAADAGHYEVVMMAYNVINGGYVEDAIRHAAAKGVGLIAMKSAHAVATHHKSLQPVPDWRVAKVERIVPGDWKAPQKAYLWSLHNPHITAVISNLWDEAHVQENLALAGQKIELKPA